MGNRRNRLVFTIKDLQWIHPSACVLQCVNDSFVHSFVPRVRKNGAGTHVATYTEVGAARKALHGGGIAADPRREGVGLIAAHLALVGARRHVEHSHRVITGTLGAGLLTLAHRVLRAVHHGPAIHTALPLLLLLLLLLLAWIVPA